MNSGPFHQPISLSEKYPMRSGLPRYGATAAAAARRNSRSSAGSNGSVQTNCEACPSSSSGVLVRGVRGPDLLGMEKISGTVENGKPKIRTSQLSLMPEGLEVLPDKDFRDLILFILNPPGDNRAWTPALRKELIGDEAAPQKAASAK